MYFKWFYWTGQGQANLYSFLPLLCTFTVLFLYLFLKNDLSLYSFCIIFILFMFPHYFYSSQKWLETFQYALNASVALKFHT